MNGASSSASQDPFLTASSLFVTMVTMVTMVTTITMVTFCRGVVR
jgi:hypothetical protein